VFMAYWEVQLSCEGRFSLFAFFLSFSSSYATQANTEPLTQP
jgi:hypothetical protein